MKFEKEDNGNISRRDFLKYLLYSGTVLYFPIFVNETWTKGVWEKYHGNPVLGGQVGTVFDPFVIKEGNLFRMWFSWRIYDSIAHTQSYDGISWSGPIRVLRPNSSSGWESKVNRASVVHNSAGYHMFYTGQTTTHSRIGYATSIDGINWQRRLSQAPPVLVPERPWEKTSVMMPHVIYDSTISKFRMWYSGGEQFEPDAIGYAESGDGYSWWKHPSNPIFRPNPNNRWESHKVTACYVLHHNDYYYMFYIGFENLYHAQIGVARSKDGITGWERNPNNPIIRRGENAWESEAVYKPTVILSGQKWWLWYNARRSDWREQIGLANHIGEDLGFD